MATEITDLIAQVERRFKDAPPDDQQTSQKLAEYAIGVLMVSGYGPPPMVLKTTWSALGQMVEQWKKGEASKLPTLSVPIGPVTEQKL